MADITTVNRKHHSGLDADKASVTGAIGETYGATDSGKLYYWNTSLSAWKTGLGYEYVPRLTNAIDKTQADFTLDGNPHVNGLDLSGIVPIGAVAVDIELDMTANAASVVGSISRSAGDGLNRIIQISQIANVPCPPQGRLVACDTDRLFDYTFPATVTAINLTVVGWFI